MNVTCPSCNTRYSVDDARVPPSGVTIKCPNCGHKFVAKPPRAPSAVPLPGTSESPPQRAPAPPRPEDVPLPAPAKPPLPAPSRRRDASAVALPGSSGNIPRSPSLTGSIDLGLDSDFLQGSEPPPASQHPMAPPPGPAPGALDTGQALDFITDNADLAQMQPPTATHPELRVRRRNGRVEGPYGIPRILAMLRNKELQGSEDISEDGVSWAAMTKNPELNAAINQLHAAQSAELPISVGTDFPIPSSLPQPVSHGPLSTGGLVRADSLDFSSDDLGTGDVRSQDVRAPDMRAPDMRAPDMRAATADLQVDEPPVDLRQPPRVDTSYASLGSPHADSQTQTMASADVQAPLSGDLSQGLELGSDLASELEVGEVPDLPPVWQTYRTPIIAFAAAIVVILIGVYTQFFTSVGAFGIPALIEVVTYEAPPRPPAAPAPAPAKVVDPKEIASLIDEHSYESFRSVFATLGGASAQLANNRLALAKARGLATLAYGPEVFAVKDLADAVESLNTIDLTAAMGGDAAAANVAFAKARLALQITAGDAAGAAQQLTAMQESHAEDKELALLLGLAHIKANKARPAVAALDRAIIADANYAPALHAIGDGVKLLGGPTAGSDAAVWYTKAFEANPNHVRSGLAAAKIYESQRNYGALRRVLRMSADGAARGLPPAERAPLYFRVSEMYDRQGRLQEVTHHALEAGRLEPGNESYVAIAAVALAESGKAKEGFAMVDPVVKRNALSVSALVARARIYVKLDDIAKGFLDLEAARKVAPNDPRISLWEARFHYDLGKFTDAQKALTRAVKLANTDPLTHVDLGRVELRLGNIDAAFERAKKAVAANADETRAHSLLGDCYAYRGQLAEAEKSYAKAYALDDENLDARLGYANMLRDQGAKRRDPAKSPQLARAIPMYLGAMQDHPNNPKVMFEYGRALELQHDITSAVALYQAAADLDKSDVRPHLKMVAAYLDPDPGSFDLAKATASLKRARSIQVSGQEVPELFFWEARVAYAAKKPRDAVSAMRSAVAGAPNDPVYQYWMGRILEGNDQLFEAITFYEKAVKLNSRYAEAILALGRTAIERKRFGEGRKHYERYRRVSPEDHWILADIGDSYMSQNRISDAERLYRELLKHDSKNARAMVQIGTIMDLRGQMKGALDYFRRATRADPNYGEGVCKYGLMLAQKGVSKRVVKILKKCVEMKDGPSDLRESALHILETP